MTEKLKPCPFCGDEAILFEAVNGETKGYYISCIRRGHIFDEPKCPVEPMISRWGTNAKEQAIEAWNKRPSPWHTGTPAEDGKYLVLWKDTDTGQEEYSMLMWHSMINSWYNLEMGALWHDEYHAEVIAWQKIEPFEETD